MRDDICKIKRIYAVMIVVFIVISFFMIIGGELYYKITGTDLGLAQTFVKADEPMNNSENVCSGATVNWVELYPFSNDNGSYEEIIYVDNRSILEKTYLMYNKIMSRLGNVGEAWNGHVFKHYVIAKWGLLINSTISSPTQGGQYVRLTDGYWTAVETTSEDKGSIIQKVNGIKGLDIFLDEEGIPFVYVQAAVKNCKIDACLPSSIVDYTNDNIDALLLELNNNGVDYIDMRKCIHDDNLDHHDLYFKTDHHWNINAGFWAANLLESKLGAAYNLNFNTNYRYKNMYTNKIYENAMFGSSGQVVTHYIEKSEDFSVLFPKFDTDFKLIIPDRGINEDGDFESLFINYEVLENEINKGGGYAYESLLYGNRPLVQIRNNLYKEGPKVLMIRDSYSLAVAPYMAIGCSELDLIDSRPTDGNFSGSIRAYIKQTKPDIVVLLVSYPLTEYM